MRGTGVNRLNQRESGHSNFYVRFRGIIKRIGTTVIMSACSHEPPSSQQLRYIIEPGDGLVQIIACADCLACRLHRRNCSAKG